MDNYITSLLKSIGVEPDNIQALHWIVIITIILLLFYGSSLFCRKILTPLVRTVTQKTAGRWDDILFSDNALKNICDLIPPIIVTVLLPFVVSSGGIMYTFIMKICSVYIIVVAVKLICAVLSSLYILSNENEKTKKHTLQGVFQMLKIAAICIGAIIIISTLINRDPVKILAGLGASAAVLMLVFKDSIMGLVAGIQLSANDMLRPGDWITMPKHNADGFVLDVTLTTVKVQNWDKTITTIPPYALVSDSFQNWRGMWNSGGRRIKRSIFIDMNSIAFCTKEQMEEFTRMGLTANNNPADGITNLTIFREHVEEWLRNHPGVNKDMIVMVRQLQPTAQGLPLELYFFFNGTDWIPYEHLQAEIFEYVIALTHRFGLRTFQSPAGSDLNGTNSRIPRHLF